MSLVEYEKKGRIAYIRLNRPQYRNALNNDLVEELKQVWLDFRQNDEQWVAVLSGNGQHFCAGRDIRADKDGVQSPLSGIAAGGTAYPSSPTTYKIWKPIIVALNGYVGGAGVLIAMSCDIKIATASTRFVLPESRVGTMTLFAAALPSCMPPSLAYEMLLTGEPIYADRAYSAGMINKVVPEEKLIEEATRYAESICRNSPVATKATKELVQRGAGLSLENQLALAEHIFDGVRSTEDFIEGRRAFAEKRQPQWKGR